MKNTMKKLFAPITAGALAVGSVFAEYTPTYVADDAPKILMDGVGWLAIGLMAFITLFALWASLNYMLNKPIFPKGRR